MAATLTVTVLEDGWLVALVRWGVGRAGGGGVGDHLSRGGEERFLCWQFRVRDKWRKGKERLVLFNFIGEGGKEWVGTCLDRWKEAYASFLFSSM